MNSQLKGAVLIIGSLFWDKEPIREHWRNTFLLIADITQEAERVIESICYERFHYQTTACDAILLDWLDLPQQSDELRLFGRPGASGTRPPLPGFVYVLSIFKTVMGMAGGKLGDGRWLLDN